MYTAEPVETLMHVIHIPVFTYQSGALFFSSVSVSESTPQVWKSSLLFCLRRRNEESSTRIFNVFRYEK